MLLADLLRRDEPFVRVRRRHADVDDGDVRRVGTDLQHQLVGVARLAHDLETGILEQARDALAQQDGVVGEDDPRASAEPDVGGVRAESREVGRAELMEPHGLVDSP